MPARAPEAFRKFFVATRQKKGLVQHEAAAELSVSSPTVSRWESGGWPHSSHLASIVKWSGVEPKKLLQMLAA